MRGIRAIFVANGIAIAAFLPFTSVILAGRGFGAAAIGLVTAGQALAFTLAVPAWSHLADVRLGRRRALVAAALGGAAVIGLAGLSFVPFVFAALVVCFSGLEAAWPPLSDALALNAVHSDPRAYGRIRLLSSLSFAGAAVLMGLLFDVAGYQPAFFICACMALLVALAATFVPDVDRADLAEFAAASGRGPGPRTGAAGQVVPARRSLPGVPPTPAAAREPAHGRGGSFVVALRVQPRLWAALAVVACCYTAIQASFTFLPLRITQLNGHPSDVALMYGIGALFEVPMMFVTGAVVARIGTRGLVAVSAVGYGVCLVAWGLLDSPAAIVAFRALGGLAYAGLWIGLVLIIGAMLPAQLQATGQGLFQIVAFGLCGVVANATGGLLFGVVGPSVFFGGAGLLACLGAGLAMLLLPAGSGRRVEAAATARAAPG